jgi:hypothetical protein
MKTLKQKLLAYLAANPGTHASGDIQRMEWRDRRGKLASPANLTRRLRELVNEGKLLVEYRKGHAHYAIAEAERPKRQVVEQLGDGSVRVSYV